MLDVLSHDRKQNQVADRRPVIRKPSDLVGPGIGASATRVTDWNNVLATFNGYFSSIRALNGPRPEPAGPDATYDIHHYAGFVTMDAEYGGKQVITDLETYIDYTRVFRRAPSDPNTIVWGSWTSSSAAPPSAYAATLVGTNVPSGTALTPLTAPTLGGSNWEETYEKVTTSVNIKKDGVYSGVVRVSTNTTSTTATVSVTMPKGLVTETLAFPAADASAFNAGVRIPFTFVNLQDTGSITVSAYHNAGFALNMFFGIDITRVGGVL